MTDVKLAMEPRGVLNHYYPTLKSVYTNVAFITHRCEYLDNVIHVMVGDTVAINKEEEKDIFQHLFYIISL